MKTTIKRLLSSLFVMAFITTFVLALVEPADAATVYTYTYYPKCSARCKTFSAGLKNIKVNASFSSRKKIAKLNGQNLYLGTSSQNRTLLKKLKSGKLIKSKKAAKKSSASSNYFPKYSGKSLSIVNALNSLRIDSSFSYRSKIASANGYANYTGSASQNKSLLNLLKQGKLRKPSSSSTSKSASNYYPKYSGTSSSLVDALNSLGINSSFSNRGKIASANGYTNYTGSVSQNKGILSLLKQGKLKKPSSASSTTQNSSPASQLIVNSSYNISVTNRALKNRPRYENCENKRNAVAYNKVIDQFSVQTNSRYRIDGNGNTWCNIFAWDVGTAMRVPLPHWVDANTQAPAEPGARNAYELNANGMYNWLASKGATYGWRSVNAYEAQMRANAGYPTVVVWKNSTGAAGHIAVCRPEGNGFYYKGNSGGPVIAQAGGSNFNYGNVSNGFGNSRLNSVVYWTHN